jgi:hypothetical protein
MVCGLSNAGNIQNTYLIGFLERVKKKKAKKKTEKQFDMFSDRSRSTQLYHGSTPIILQQLAVDSTAVCKLKAALFDLGKKPVVTTATFSTPDPLQTSRRGRAETLHLRYRFCARSCCATGMFPSSSGCKADGNDSWGVWQKRTVYYMSSRWVCTSFSSHLHRSSHLSFARFLIH